MLSISRPLGAAKVSEYFREDYGVKSSYWASSKDLHGDWRGKMAEAFGLGGQQITAEHFDRLALGQHPITGEQIIKHRDTITQKTGEASSHRAGWDLVFSASKSVSLAALVGGDDRIVAAHRLAVRVALEQGERLIQAHLGGNRGVQTTGRMIAATFDHDSSRPVDGYAAAQLHTHSVIFNVTETAEGKFRSLQSHELYVANGFMAAVYHNTLERELRRLGYETTPAKNGKSPEIVGFSEGYLASESRRSQEITKEVEERGLGGAEARFIAAHTTRKEKGGLTPEQIRAAHLENGEKFGNEAQRIVSLAQPKTLVMDQSYAEAAVEFARKKLSEREAVFDHHDVMREALNHSRGRATLSQIANEMTLRREAGAFIEVDHVRPHAPLWRYTTPEGIRDERRVIERVLGAGETEPIHGITAEELIERFPQQNEWQRKITLETVNAPEQITGIQGSAGVGKSFSLEIIRQLAKENGRNVYGLAPTSRAARELRDVGIPEAQTVQRFLMAGNPGKPGQKNLYFIDESSLSAARQLNRVLKQLNPEDRVLIVGDRRQHNAVEAGRMFEELQVAGMKTARINKLIRQKSPELRSVVEAMARGQMVQGVQLLQDQNRIVSIPNRRERFAALAREYAVSPDNTLVVSPDNLSRQQLNAAIREEMKKQGKIEPHGYQATVLVAHGEMTNADRRVASSYDVGDVIYWQTSSKAGTEAKTYGTVLDRDADSNTITVKKQSGEVITYDPAKSGGGQAYRQELRELAPGDRMMFTAPYRRQAIQNRDVGTVLSVDSAGNAEVSVDGRKVRFNIKDNPHVDYGYVWTSHASQSATVDRVLVQIDTGDSRIRQLVNQTLAYVALSRPRYEARVFTDNAAELASALSKVNRKTTALSREQVEEYKKKGFSA